MFNLITSPSKTHIIDVTNMCMSPLPSKKATPMTPSGSSSAEKSQKVALPLISPILSCSPSVSGGLGGGLDDSFDLEDGDADDSLTTLSQMSSTSQLSQSSYSIFDDDPSFGSGDANKVKQKKKRAKKCRRKQEGFRRLSRHGSCRASECSTQTHARARVLALTVLFREAAGIARGKDWLIVEARGATSQGLKAKAPYQAAHRTSFLPNTNYVEGVSRDISIASEEGGPLLTPNTEKTLRRLGMDSPLKAALYKSPQRALAILNKAYIIDIAHDNSELGVLMSGTDELPKAVNNTDQRLEDMTEKNNAKRLRDVMLGAISPKEAAREAKAEIEEHFRGAKIHLGMVVGHLEKMLEQGFDLFGEEADQMREALGVKKQRGMGAIRYPVKASPASLRAGMEKDLGRAELRVPATKGQLDGTVAASLTPQGSLFKNAHIGRRNTLEGHYRKGTHPKMRNRQKKRKPPALPVQEPGPKASTVTPPAKKIAPMYPT